MEVVKQPTTPTAAMESLLRHGICTQATRQWLDQNSGDALLQISCRLRSTSGWSQSPAKRLKTDRHYCQTYNYQVAVGVSNQAPVVEYLEPMLQRICFTAGALHDVISADAGYSSDDNAKVFTQQEIDAVIAPGLMLHGQLFPSQRAPMPRMTMRNLRRPES